MLGRQEANADQRDSLAASLLRSLLVVVPIYALIAWNLGRGYQGRFDISGPASQQVASSFAAMMIIIFTITHGVGPVFFYRLFFLGNIRKRLPASSGAHQVISAIGCFVTIHMTIWYGIPIIALAVMTGWWNFAWAVGHILLAGRGRRRWALLEHGSTALALVLFLVFFRADNMYPMGIVVILFQSLLLTLVNWKGRGLWVASVPDG